VAVGRASNETLNPQLSDLLSKILDKAVSGGGTILDIIKQLLPVLPLGALKTYGGAGTFTIKATVCANNEKTLSFKVYGGWTSWAPGAKIPPGPEYTDGGIEVIPQRY